MEPAREHSRKPDISLDRVEALSSGPYLEMFSRSDREGWDSWGSEAGKFNTPELPRFDADNEDISRFLNALALT